jgi:hypothetical protein
MRTAGMLFALSLSSLAARADSNPLAAAEQAYQDHDYGKARQLARQVLDGKTEPAVAQKAWRLVGVTSCLLKDRSGAIGAFPHLARADADLIRFSCQKNGIDVSEEEATIAASPARADVERAQAAYSAGRYAEAKKAADEASRKDPKLGAGWRIAGSAACWLKDKLAAQKALDHLQPIDQEQVRSICFHVLGAAPKRLR